MKINKYEIYDEIKLEMAAVEMMDLVDPDESYEDMNELAEEATDHAEEYLELVESNEEIRKIKTEIAKQLLKGVM